MNKLMREFYGLSFDKIEAYLGVAIVSTLVLFEQDFLTYRVYIVMYLQTYSVASSSSITGIEQVLAPPTQDNIIIAYDSV